METQLNATTFVSHTDAIILNQLKVVNATIAETTGNDVNICLKLSGSMMYDVYRYIMDNEYRVYVCDHEQGKYIMRSCRCVSYPEFFSTTRSDVYIRLNVSGTRLPSERFQQILEMSKMTRPTRPAQQAKSR